MPPRQGTFSGASLTRGPPLGVPSRLLLAQLTSLQASAYAAFPPRLFTLLSLDCDMHKELYEQLDPREPLLQLNSVH